MESELKKSLDEKFQELLNELERKSHKTFNEHELWKMFKKSVSEYSKMAYGEIDEEYVDRQFRSASFLIDVSISEYDMCQKIIFKIIEFKLAKVIFQYELKKTDFQKMSLQEKRDQAKNKAYAYIFRNSGDIDLKFDPNEEKPMVKIIKVLHSKYHKPNQGMQDKSSGCMLIIASMITLSLVILGFNFRLGLG